MTPTKSQQAQEYAEKKFPELLLTIEKELWPKTRELLAQAYTDGYTAAEQSMWRSVEEELPSNDDKVFVIIHGAYVCGWYDQKYELWKYSAWALITAKTLPIGCRYRLFPTLTPRRNEKLD